LPSDSPQVISDLDIRDEFASTPPESSLRDIAGILAKNEVKVILIVDKGKREVVGIITEQRFLQACATGVDPADSVAHDYMSTNILRLLGDTPLQAARDLIDEKEPDAVIAMADDRKFRGYLSPEDYRYLRSLTKGAPVIPPAPPVVISDVQIRDEFASLSPEATLRDVAKILAKNEVKVILTVDRDKKEVVGVITEQRFLQACATGVDPEQALAHDYMSTDILRLLENTPIQAVIDLVEEKEPDAVIVLTAARKFRGYLSPEDYRQLEGSPVQEKPPLSDDIITLTEDEVSTGVAKYISNDTNAPVIWAEDGSEIAIHSDSITVLQTDGFARFSVDLECDQTDREKIPVHFYVGPVDELNNLHASCEACPDGSAEIVGRWGRHLQDALWDGLLATVSEAAGNHGNRLAQGFGSADHLFYIRLVDGKPIEQDGEKGGRKSSTSKGKKTSKTKTKGKSRKEVAAK